jgi:hypothetical protein
MPLKLLFLSATIISVKIEAFKNMINNLVPHRTLGKIRNEEHCIKKVNIYHIMIAQRQ